jgi:SAM-dependent methyltransferase
MSVPDTDFDRERQWWDAKALKEETDSADEIINRALRWREIELRLDGVRTILDVGAATGVFSVPLAQRGFRVVHLDLSPEMLSLARKKAGGLPNIEFVEGNAADLTRFSDRAFDLVLNMDGAISFSGSKAIQAIHETCRVAKDIVIMTVSHQALLTASWVGASLARTGRLASAVHAMMCHGEWHQDQFPDNEYLTVGLTQNYMGALKAFLPCEIAGLLEGEGMEVLRCGGLGSLAALCDRETTTAVARDSALLDSFLDVCEQFDSKVLPGGPGSRQRAGLIAVARRRS